MNKLTSFISCTICAILIIALQSKVNAQTIRFERQPSPSPELPNVADILRCFEGDSDFGDVDGDGDMDLIVCGSSFSNVRRFTNLYLNDGNGNFYLSSDFHVDSVVYGSVAFADLDGDNDQDFIITGYTNNSQYITKQFENNGSSIFTQKLGSPFTAVSRSTINYADIDNDNDLDVLITGYNSSLNEVSQLYTNDGFGNFSLVLSTPFQGVINGGVDFADVDGDNDLDVLIVGETSTSRSAKLFLNQGNASFIENPLAPFRAVEGGAVKFNDIDGDGDQDVIMTGYINNSNVLGEVYLNNGSGGFTLSTASNLMGVSYGVLELLDIDGDNDDDLIIAGRGSSSNKRINVYKNSNGVFTSFTRSELSGGVQGSISVADVDGDSDIDVFLTGLDTLSPYRGASLFINDSTGIFKLAHGNSLPGVSSGDSEFGDVDGDGDLDLITESYFNNERRAVLYKNDGFGNFLPSTWAFDLSAEEVELSDVDGDGDLDALLYGKNSSGFKRIYLYLNNGLGVFTKTTSTPFRNLAYNCAFKFADVDGDNDLDLLLIGEEYGNYYTELYINNGVGSFTLNTGSTFDTFGNGDIEFADYDNDNDLDVLIAGETAWNQISTKLYSNNGSGVFTEVTGMPFIGIVFPDIEFADVNGDQYPDILIIGTDANNADLTQYYLNDGTGNFIVPTNFQFEHIANGNITFADIDNDNDQDLMINGNYINGIYPYSELMLNDGSGVFTKVNDTRIHAAANGSTIFGDIDSDNDVDLYQIGTDESNNPIARLYLNLCGSYRDTLVMTVCDSFAWKNSLIYHTSGHFYDTTQNSNGCDSIHFLDLTVLSNDTIIPVSACVSYLWPENNHTYTQSGFYYDTLSNRFGCDSINQLDLIINLPTANIQSLSLCDESYYIWRGDTISSSGLYKDTLINSLGCDSLLSLNLTFAQSQIIEYSDSACSPYLWSVNNQLYDSSGIYSDTILSAQGCDSISILNLTIGQANDTLFIDTACDNYTWGFNNILYSQSGTYRDTIQTLIGCDSIGELQLTIKPSSSSVVYDTACNYYSWPLSGKTYNTSGSYEQILTNSIGCDSTVTLELTIDSIRSIEEVDTFCTHYYWNKTGLIYTQSGLYYDTLSVRDNCDSIIQLNLTIQPFDTSISKSNNVLTANQEGVTYQWVDCLNDFAVIRGATDRVYTVDSNGTYSVILTSSVNCVDTANCVQVTRVGIEEIFTDNQFKIYPNPSNGEVFIEIVDHKSTNDNIQIRDITGKVLYEKRWNPLIDKRVSIQNLASGVYFIHYKFISKKLILIK